MEQQQPVQVTPLQPPRGNGGAIGAWFAVFFAVALLISVGFNLMLLTVSTQVPKMEASPSKMYKEVLVDGDPAAEKSILLIDFSGVIMPGDSRSALGISAPGIVSSTIAQLREAQKDSNIKAVILNMDTPGGTVDASEMIYNEVLKTRATGGVDGKKIVIQMNAVAASGGYYISAPADLIVAHPTTITGSIGVIMEIPNIQKALEYLNIEMITLTAGTKKDWGSAFDEFTSDEREYFQNILNQMYDRFVDIVAKGREMSKEEVLKLATGEVFLGPEAKENGLVDEIGFLEDTFALTRELIGDSKAKIIRYSSTSSFFQQLFEGKAPPLIVNTGVNIDLLESLNKVPQFKYQWKAGR